MADAPQTTDRPYCGACLNDGVECRYPECIEEMERDQQETRHLTLTEQKVMHRALRRSVRKISDG